MRTLVCTRPESAAVPRVWSPAAMKMLPGPNSHDRGTHDVFVPSFSVNEYEPLLGQWAAPKWISQYGLSDTDDALASGNGAAPYTSSRSLPPLCDKPVTRQPVVAQEVGSTEPEPVMYLPMSLRSNVPVGACSTVLPTPAVIVTVAVLVGACPTTSANKVPNVAVHRP